MPSILGFQASFAIGDQVDEAQMAIIVIGTSCEVRVNKNIIQTPGVGALVMCPRESTVYMKNFYGLEFTGVSAAFAG